MRKLLALLIFSFTLVTAQAALPAPLQEFVDAYNTELAGQSADGMKFGRAVLEGIDIVVPIYMDDSELLEYNMGLKDAIDLMGGEEYIESLMLLAVFEEGGNDETLALLKKYKYNFVFRIIGTASKDKVNIRIRWQDI